MIKILVVDDDALICKHMSHFFNQNFGHMVFAVDDPTKAMTIIDKEAPHIVLLDIFMEPIDGLQILKQIRQKYGNTIKVIMITAGNEAERIEAIKLGADDFFHKPFDTQYLRDSAMEKIQEVLGLRRKQPIAQADIPVVLVVDDEKDSAFGIKYFLERLIECVVDVVFTGEAALAVIASKKYDLIFLDIKLPGFSGLDVLRQIKKDNNAQDVIMVSAYNDGDVADMSRKAGAVNYITKPVYMENFQKLLKEIFEKKGKYFVKG